MASITKNYEGSHIVKSAADPRQYLGLELTNGLKILLVSDPETDKSSAAMDVHIGHLKDPRSIPGLAHFCEHMLFLGTEKYPVENEYKKFLSEHGGTANAFTSMEHTNYFFDVSPDHLQGALDRFAQFFLCPLFTPSATGREVNAVNSENSQHLQSDPRRLFVLDKSLARQDHDFSKFGTGNKETLETIPKNKGIDVRDELLKFHTQFYSSNIMGLCIVGKESLDQLRDMVVPYFKNSINKNVAIPRWDSPPFTENELQCVVHTVPVKDIRKMTVMWPTPDVSEHYRANYLMNEYLACELGNPGDVIPPPPGQYLSHLLGHKGSGSMLSELKARGWADTLSGNQWSAAKGFSFFTVTVELTEKGQENTDEIICLIYQYINMLRAEGPQEWIFRECQDLAALAFNFKDKEAPRDYTRAMAGRLQDYPMTDVLSVHALFDQFKPELIKMILDRLVPSNMRVTVVSKKFEGQTDQREKWYGTEYKITNFTPQQMKMWTQCGISTSFHLPMRNEFIPTNFELVERESEALPDVVKNTPFCRLWYKQDNKFLKPKACVNLLLKSPLAYIDPLHTNLTYLFTQLFKDALTEYSYMAEVAGLRYNLDSSADGLTLTIKGYNDKLTVLLEKILEKMTTFTVDPDRLEIFKEIRGRNLKNFHAEQPREHAMFYTSMLISEVMWTKEELQQVLDDVTTENLQAFIRDFLSRLYIEGLMYGNITKTQSLEMMDLIEKILTNNNGTKPLSPSQHQRLRQVQLPDGSYFIYEQKNKVHESSSIEIYYQCGPENIKSNMLLQLCCQVISEPCFTTLRTQEQLGYIVASGVRKSKGAQGLRVIVQTPRHPQYVEGRIEAFLQKMETVIQDLSEEEFNKHVAALSTKRLDKPKQLVEQNNKYWNEIISSYYNFDRDNIEVAFLKELTKEDLYRFYKEKIGLDAPQRHKLSVHIVSDVPPASSKAGSSERKEEPMADADTKSEKEELLPAPALPLPTIVIDVMKFKRDVGLYPLPKPFIEVPSAEVGL